MAPKFEWWAKGNNNSNRKGTPVVVKMENPNNWSMVELESPSDEDFLIEKSRNKNARQLTWVLLLKAHRAAGCLTSLGSALITLGTAVRRRIAAGRTDSEISVQKQNPAKKSKLFYSCLKVFLWLSLILLGFEIAAYFKGWHFGTSKLQLQFVFTTPFGVRGFFDWVYTRWVLLRVQYLAPPLQFLANGCIVLFLVQSLDRLILCLGCFWIRFKKIKPVPKPDAVSDLESGDNGCFVPMVLVQIPMCNEKEVIKPKTKRKNKFELICFLNQVFIFLQVYQQSIAAVCNLDWPKTKILIQILDDSDDPITQSLIKEEVHKWQKQGARIVYRHRVNREGYKAGNLKSAMNCSYVKDYEFVAIFDADFQPLPDFLKKTIPHFKVKF